MLHKRTSEAVRLAAFLGAEQAFLEFDAWRCEAHGLFSFIDERITEHVFWRVPEEFACRAVNLTDMRLHAVLKF